MSVLGLLVLLGGCSAVVRDGQYYQDICYRLSGASICWPSDTLRDNFTDSGKFVPADVIATRFQAWRDQIFVLTPKYRPGVPFTLGKFDILQRCFPCLQPFPNYGVQQGCSPDDIHNAVDLFVDNRDILWLLDIGVINTLTSPQVKGPPKVIALDALSGRLVHTVDLSSLTCAPGRLQYLLVDYCLRTGTPWVYVSDAASRTILVYDVAGCKGHRVVLPKVVNKDGPRDVLYTALIKRIDQVNRVYLSYLSSNRMFSIKTTDLRYPNSNGTVMDEGKKPATMVLVGTADNNIFFRYKGKPNILMWNVDSTFRERNFIPVQEGEEGRLATQVSPGFGGMVWVMESNFQDYLKNTTGCLGASVLLHPLVKP